MGKKKIKEQSKEELIKEQGALDAASGRSSQEGKKSKKIEKGRVYISASYNNTMITVTDESGRALAWASAGSLGFAGPKKATPFASSKVVAAIAEKLKNNGPQSVEVFVRGIGGGRDSALRSLVNHGFNLLNVKDVTPVPHNGPRPKKIRRV